MAFFRKIIFAFLSLLLRRSVGASLLLFSTFAPQILPTIASYHQTASIQNEDLKNKKISYKETRKRKHSKNKSNLKNQTALNCNLTPIIKTETLPSVTSYAPSVWNPINRKFYIFGGFTGSRLNQIFEYDPTTGTVVTKSETLPTGRYGTSAVWNPVNNKAYVFGGTDAGGDLDQIVEYDPASGTVTIKTETLPSARHYTSAGWDPVNNKAYIIGGTGLNQIIEYNPATGTVTTKAETLPTARDQTSTVWNPVNNKFYIIGGSDGSNLNQILEYDPALGTVITKSETLPYGRQYAPAVWSLTNNKIYIFGGRATSPAYSNQIVEYDPSTGTVTAKSETLPAGRAYNSAVWNPINNKAYIFGGYGNSTGFLNQIVEYSPCNPPSNPSISSVTINGTPQTVSSSYRIVAGQTLIVNVSASDAYPGNQVALSCSPPAGKFTSSPAYLGTGRLEFTPDATNVGNNYSYTFNAVSNSGAVAASTLSFTVAVSCSPPDNGCTNRQICVRNSCCDPCQFRTGICATDPSCVFTPVSQPLISSPTSSAPALITPIPTPAATSTTTPTPTAIPAPNITNSGSTNFSQGPNISTPSINTAPSTNTQKPSGFISVSEGTVKGVSSPPKPTPTNIPGLPPGLNYLDISKLKPSNNVKPDSAPYIDFSQQK